MSDELEKNIEKQVRSFISAIFTTPAGIEYYQYTDLLTGEVTTTPLNVQPEIVIKTDSGDR